MNEKLDEYKYICPYFETKCEDLQCACPKYLAYKAIQEPGVIEQIISEMGVDPTSDSLTLMLGMQKHLVELFHTVDGLTKDEVDHWVGEYITCIEDELREVREYLDWKPWEQNTKDNVAELKKELIDIWHFLMDMMLVGGIKDSNTLFKNYDLHSNIGLKQRLEFIINNERTWMSQYHTIENISRDDRDWLMLFYNNCMQDALGAVRQQISWKHWKKPNPEIDYAKLHTAIIEVFKYLVDMMILVGITADKWVDIYIKKNCENKFRQKFGY